ncbi:MAG: hypothetical protein BMS9Abin13_540 [Patescibacteria group bacterium]|nr:MAG: hypothetical protein BMS9Abin13_540 [Patescibacteria group bacterium]
MKWSNILHYLAVASIALGILSFAATYIAGEEGRFLGLDQEHLYKDAFFFILLAIAFALGVIIHKDKEKL